MLKIERGDQPFTRAAVGGLSTGVPELDEFALFVPAIEAGTQPLVTADDAAGAVADVWRCYRAGGYGDAKYIDVG